MTVKPQSKYCCDSDCPMWKCCKLCSHTIACAFVDGCLQTFLNQSTSPPKLYELAKSDTTKSAGKKPTRRKASTKSATKAIAQLQSSVQPLDLSPVGPLTSSAATSVEPLTSSTNPRVDSTCMSVNSPQAQSIYTHAYTSGDSSSTTVSSSPLDQNQCRLASASQMRSSPIVHPSLSTGSNVSSSSSQSMSGAIDVSQHSGVDVSPNMTQHPNVSISQITASSAATFNMSASSVTQSPNIFFFSK